MLVHQRVCLQKSPGLLARYSNKRLRRDSSAADPWRATTVCQTLLNQPLVFFQALHVNAVFVAGLFHIQRVCIGAKNV